MISVVLSVITFTRIRYHSHATEIKKQFAHNEWNPINVIIERVKTKTHKIGASETQTQNLQTRCHWIFWFCYFGCNVSLLWVANWWCDEKTNVYESENWADFVEIIWYSRMFKRVSWIFCLAKIRIQYIRIRQQTLSWTISKFKLNPRYFQNLACFLYFYELFGPKIPFF